MSAEELRLTVEQLDLLMFLCKNSNKAFTHAELTAEGFRLKAVNTKDFWTCIARKGYNESNYTYQITDAGIAYCEEYEKRTEKESDEKQYRDKSLEIAEKANKRALWSNVFAIASILIAVLSLFQSCRQ